MAKIGRQNHLNHLISVMPLITIVYGIQCYIIYLYADGIPIGDYALFLGCSLAFLISFLVYYDNNHHVFICADHLHISFGLFGTDKKIFYHNIEKIDAPKDECAFSSLTIKTKSKDQHVIYFVDFPVAVKMVIEQLMSSQSKIDQTKNDHKDQAA